MVRYALVLALFLFGCGMLGQAQERPAGTCGGWVDKDKNKLCDRSERKEKPCRSSKCPASAHNPDVLKKLKKEQEKEGAGAKGTMPSPDSQAKLGADTGAALLPKGQSGVRTRCDSGCPGTCAGCAACQLTGRLDPPSPESV